MQRQILVDVEEAFEAHQHSNEESNVWRSVTVQHSLLCSRVFQERCDRKARLPFRQHCAPRMTLGILLVRTTLKGLSDGYHACLTCLAFFSICFETPCFGPRLEFFLMTKQGIEVKSQLGFCSVVGLRESFKFLPQLQEMIPISEKALQSGH